MLETSTMILLKTVLILTDNIEESSDDLDCSQSWPKSSREHQHHGVFISTFIEQKDRLRSSQVREHAMFGEHL